LWSGFVSEAARVGLTKADYFRALLRRALGRPVQVKMVPPVNDDTALELNRIGNNLNQLVRLLHTRSEEDPGIDELVAVVGETIVQLVQVQAEVRGA
jgi:hypothetical protein